jgi:hypothetical protein
MSKLQLWRELKIAGNPDALKYRQRGQLTREYVDNVNDPNRTLVWDGQVMIVKPPQLRSITYNADLFWGDKMSKASRTIRVAPDATDDQIIELIESDLDTHLDDYGQTPDRYEIKYNETKLDAQEIDELDLELGNVLYDHYNSTVNILQQSKNCVLHAIRDSIFCSRYKPPNFPEILKVVDREYKVGENNKLTPREMGLIAREFKLNLLIVGIDNKVIINYIDPSTKFGSNRGSLMCIAAQGHCYTIDKKYRKSFACSKRAKMYNKNKKESKQKQIKIVNSLRQGLEHKGISLIDKPIHVDDVLDLMHEEKKLFSLDVQRGNYLNSIKYRDSIIKFNSQPQVCIDIARREKIPFNGQQLGSLANSMIKGLTESSLSVNARDIFVNRNNSAINFCHGESFDKAFDISKCYTSCLRDIDEYPIYTIFDDPEPWDGKIICGFYYIETRNTFPLSGNGWYYSELVQYCKDQNIQMDILYQLIPQYTQPNPFRDDIKKIYKKYPAHAKNIINYYIGYLNSRAKDSERMLITSSFQEFLCYSSQGFHIDKDKGLYYLTYTKKAMHKSKTQIPVYASIIDKAKIKIHQLAMKVGGELVAVKTDCIYVKGDYKTPKLSKSIGGYRIDSSCLPAMNTRLPSGGIYKLPDRTPWQLVDSIQDSCCVNGGAGTGKSYLINNDLPQEYARLAFTNTAARNIQGKTFHAHHNLFDEESEPILKDDSLVLDEYSMLPEDLYAHLLTKRSLFPESKIILVGDDRQIQFIPKGLKKNKDSPRVSDTDTFKRICNYKKLELTECKRASDKFFNLCLAGEYNKLEDKTMRHQLTNIVRTNLLRGKLNRQINKQFARGKTALLTIDGWNFNREGDSQTQVKGKLEIVEGSRWISREANKKLNIIKNDFYDIKDGNFVNQDGNIVPLSYYKNFCLRWAMTVNKCQGMTINDKFSIWESDMMDKYALYTAVSRATRIGQFRFR